MACYFTTLREADLQGSVSKSLGEAQKKSWLTAKG